MSQKLQLSIVLPCLNEEATLGGCIDQIRQSLDSRPVAYEIIVADNGSRDQSPQIARQKGARLVAVSERGYGAAIQGGIAASAGEYVIFVDADGTYFLDQTYELYQATQTANADMGMANRLTHRIEKGAMPFLHRYLGTPVLTWLINTLFRGRIRDCNSGFRCLRRQAYDQWEVHSTGMEFASELLIKALKARAKIIGLDSGLGCGRPGRVAHLRTWRDGMRHLLFILSEKPQLLEITGLLTLLIASLIQVLTVVMGPTHWWGVNLFSLHSQAFLLVAALTGLQFYLFSCYIFLSSHERSLALTRRLIQLDEGVLFFVLAACLTGEILVFLGTVLLWARLNFGGLNVIGRLLPFIHFISLPLITSVGLAGIHTFKRNMLFRQVNAPPPG